MTRRDHNEAGHRIGEGHPNARHSDWLVELVFMAKEAGLKSPEVAAELRLPPTTVRSIWRGQARCQQINVEAKAWEAGSRSRRRLTKR